jgi:hypothetical protein
MKKILIGLVAMLLSNCAISQTSPTSEKIIFSVPSAAKKRIKPVENTSKSFKNHGFVNLADLKSGMLYDIGNIKFFVEAADSENKSDFLTVIRESLLDQNNSGVLKWTIDPIKELNNFIYLKGTCKYAEDPTSYVTILAVDKTYTRQMRAFIEYDEKDKQAGDKVVQDFLKSVKFK